MRWDDEVVRFARDYASMASPLLLEVDQTVDSPADRPPIALGRQHHALSFKNIYVTHVMAPWFGEPAASRCVEHLSGDRGSDRKCHRILPGTAVVGKAP